MAAMILMIQRAEVEGKEEEEKYKKRARMSFTCPLNSNAMLRYPHSVETDTMCVLHTEI